MGLTRNRYAAPRSASLSARGPRTRRQQFPSLKEIHAYSSTSPTEAPRPAARFSSCPRESGPSDATEAEPLT